MSKETLLAVDPGKGGALAVFQDRILVSVQPFTTSGEISDMVLAETQNLDRPYIRAVIEQVGAMPGQGVTSMFSFGENFGFWQGLLLGLGIPFERVRPQVWQRGLPGLLKLKGADRKRALASLARERFPIHKLTLKTADAALLGDWYLRR